MFFEMELMTRSAVGSAWRAGHRLPAGESAHLQRICQELGAMLTIEDRRSRMSQRTGSILVSGAARLYKEKADAVLKDTSSFMLSITSGGPREGRSGPEPSSSSDTGSEDTPPGDGNGSGETQLVPASGTPSTSTGPAPLVAEKEVRRKSRKRVTTVFPTPDGWTNTSRNRNSEENNGESSASRETGAVIPLWTKPVQHEQPAESQEPAGQLQHASNWNTAMCRMATGVAVVYHHLPTLRSYIDLINVHASGHVHVSARFIYFSSGLYCWRLSRSIPPQLLLQQTNITVFQFNGCRMLVKLLG